MTILTIFGFLAEGLSWLGWLLVVGYLFVLPGWGILSLVWAGWDELDRVEKLGIAAGTSLALHAVGVVWTNLVGLQLGALYAWLPGAIGLVCLARAWRSKYSLQWRIPEWESVAAFVVIGLIFAVRFWVIRTLVAPSYGDSVHHTFLAQLFLDHGGLFQSWLPYAPYASFSTHFGFSFHVALFSWLTGMESVNATLVVGQILNGLAIVGLYPLAKLISGNSRWAGICALMLAGLFSPMPGFYVNWGRYAQLAGQVVLPTALWMVVKVLEDGTSGLFNFQNLRKLVLAGAVLAGMVLNYFRMPLYYAAFVPGWLLMVGLARWKLQWRQWGRVIIKLIVVGCVGIVFFLPWAITVSQNAVGEFVEKGVATAFTWQDIVAGYQIFREWSFFVPPGLAVLGGIGWLWAVFRRNGNVMAVGFWALLLSSLVAARIIRLPGASLMQNFAVLIALYIPVAWVGGWLLGEMFRGVAGWVGRWGTAFVAGGVILGAGWGAVEQRKIMDPAFIMVTAQDMAAMDWIKQNTPPDAVFLVESYLILNGTSAVGADAGWWIPLLAGRANTMPPQYALLAEKPLEPGYSQQVVELVAQVEQAGLRAPETLALLCDWEITHAYIGQGQGLVGLWVVQLFDAEDFENTPFSRVYTQDQVSIYELDQAVCGGAP